MKNILMISGCLFLSLATSCEKSGLIDGIGTDVDLRLSVDQSTIYEGESVTFSLDYTAAALAIYTGDDGHDYDNSYYALMEGLSDEQLLEDVYLNADDSTEEYAFSLSTYQAGVYDEELLTYFDYTRKDGDNSTPFNATSRLGEDSDGITIDDDGKTVFCTNQDFTSDVTYWNDRYVHFKSLGQEINDNQTLVLRMKFLGVGDESLRVQAIVNIVGRESEDDAPQYSKTEIYTLYDYPSEEYQDYSFDLSNVVVDWEARTTKSLNYIDELVIMIRDFDGKVEIDGSNYGSNITGYCIESMSYSGVTYFPLSTGYSVTTSDSSGIATFDYTYNEVGTFRVLAIATNNGVQTTDELTIEVLERPESDQSGDFNNPDDSQGDWLGDVDASGDFDDVDSSEGKFNN